MTCWAAPLGDCAGGTSREHIISESQFDANGITIVGLPWCKETPRTVGLGSLTARNLCRDHNTALSPVDAEAARFKRALGAARAGVLPVRCRLDARLIERWLLKTTINLTLQEPTTSGMVVTPVLVRRAFGVDATPSTQGFFIVAEEGEQIAATDGIRFETMLRNSDDMIVIATFVFHGYRMLYAFDDAPAIRGAMRPRQINLDASWIKLRWRPDFGSDDGVMAPRATGGR
jgi:hypothetical protein